jgi:hypothetical protein
MIKSINFKYKGDRNYVHGTDIFSEITSFVENEYGALCDKINIDMSIHSIIKNCMDMYDFTDSSNHDKCNVVFNLNCNNNFNKRLVLIENEESVRERYEYHEEEIIANAKIEKENKRIWIDDPDKYSFIENSVALNKGLLNSLYDSNLKGKWYFTRIRLKDFNFSSIKSFTSLQIEFKKNLHFRITDSVIFLNGKNIGNIYFSLV